MRLNLWPRGREHISIMVFFLKKINLHQKPMQQETSPGKPARKTDTEWILKLPRRKLN